MAIFQKSVIKKHLNNLDKEQVDKAYQKFKENYSPSKIEKIKQLKEEEYQDGFFRDLFVDVFGYTLKPDDNYNLVREFKNQTDGRKADGAVIRNNGVNPVAIAVIELKSTKTKDFKSVTEQAFGYKNNQPECKYVIISNFQKLRFYVDYANEYEEFDLFHLPKAEFELLYLILHKESIFSNLPFKLKEETKFHEQEVSGKLYKDYSNFRKKLFEDLIKNNLTKGACPLAGVGPLALDKLTLFKKSQKLLDRFLFILFAEDSGLLPPNSISRIIETYHKLKELDAYKPIYDIYKQYFGYMNVGRKGKSSSNDIPAYNGGLFYPDELLDSLKIDDEILIGDLLKLSEYDFNTEVDVNILGHIFEHSLSEIEEITAEIEGTTADKTKSKRKKDGVFYTPKYITQYIVENTVGTLCTEKRKELEIEEIEFDGTYKTKDGKLLAKGKKLYQKLNDYKDWLLSLKIVDPACGSGAFLNQALNFLIWEHKDIDDIIAELTNTALRLFDTDIAILENNLYGVDINEESVEIAKLSLWLLTAQKGRKLSNLNHNIKCGNSLIDDPEIAGDRAFNWNVEFQEIMQNGGFDVVIGNPPYKAGRHWADKDSDLHGYLTRAYETADYQLDLYVLFYERSLHLLKKNDGLLSFIAPNTWFTNISSKGMREYFLCNSEITQILDCSKVDVFEDAVVETAIVTMKYRKVLNNKVAILQLKESEAFILHDIEQKNWLNDDNFYMNIYVNEQEQKLKSKIDKTGTPLGNFCEAKFGVKIYQVGKGKPKQTKDIAVDRLFESDEKLSDDYFKMLEGKDVNRYNISWQGRWIKYGVHLAEPRNIELFQGNRFLVRRIMGKRVIACCTDEPMISNALLHVVKVPNEYSVKVVLSIVSSSLMAFYFRKSSGREDKAFPEIKVHQLRSLPIVISKDSLIIEPISDRILKITSEFYATLDKFSKYLQSQFSLDKLSRKLQSWHELEFGEFIKELNKAIKKVGGEKLSKMGEMEWMEVFETQKAEAQTLKAEIDKTDKEIDQMVYELYGLSDEEIEIVDEGS